MRRKKMSDLKKPFVIIMDEHLSSHPKQWAYVHEDETEELAMCHSDYDHVLGTYPRDVYEASRIAPMNLIYTPTGQSQAGGVYKITAAARRAEKNISAKMRTKELLYAPVTTEKTQKRSGSSKRRKQQ
jgi:hypothetical protein